MAQILMIIKRLLTLHSIINTIRNLFKKKLPPTATDTVYEAFEKADKICMDMETLGFVLGNLGDLIPDDPAAETKLSGKEKVGLKLKELGLEPETFDQMCEWNEKARFSWNSFRDELKILITDKMSKDQRNDRTKAKPVKIGK